MIIAFLFLWSLALFSFAFSFRLPQPRKVLPAGFQETRKGWNYCCRSTFFFHYSYRNYRPSTGLKTRDRKLTKKNWNYLKIPTCGWELLSFSLSGFPPALSRNIDHSRWCFEVCSMRLWYHYYCSTWCFCWSCAHNHVSTLPDQQPRHRSRYLFGN